MSFTEAAMMNGVSALPFEADETVALLMLLPSVFNVEAVTAGEEDNFKFDFFPAFVLASTVSPRKKKICPFEDDVVADEKKPVSGELFFLEIEETEDDTLVEKVEDEEKLDRLGLVVDRIDRETEEEEAAATVVVPFVPFVASLAKVSAVFNSEESTPYHWPSTVPGSIEATIASLLFVLKDESLSSKHLKKKKDLSSRRLVSNKGSSSEQTWA